MTAAHPIEAAIHGLVALWTGAPELIYDVDGVQTPLVVVDGYPMQDLDDPRVLLVGTGAQHLPGGAQATSSHGYGSRHDQVDVGCELRVWSGDTRAAVVRAQALAVLDAAARRLALNRDLGGVVDWTRVVRSAYEPMQDEAGSLALIEFTVRVDATRFEGV